MAKGLTVAFFTLGCRVNQYETEALRERMAERGFSSVEEGERADIYVVNTCTVTNISDRKSRQLIRRARRSNPEGIVAVIGCYAHVKPEEIASMEEVDIVLESGEKSLLPDLIEDYIAGKRSSGVNDDYVCGKSSSKLDNKTDRVLNKNNDEPTELFDDLGTVTSMESRSRALIKIEDGCDRYCAFCIIPYARGPVRSRAAEKIIEEAERLVAAEYRELVITGINMALYGRDFAGSDWDIVKLVSRINDIEGDFRIRLGSLEPTVIDLEQIGRLLQCEKLCPSLHLSLQSGSDKILEKMGRNYSREDYLNLIAALKRHDSNFGVSTDVIVGFPGEEEEDFQASLSLVEKVDFLHVHVFPFSVREVTAAAHFDGQIRPELKAERSRRLIVAADRGAERFAEANIGGLRRVLAEKMDVKSGLLEGLSENGVRVYFEGGDELLGCLVDVKIDYRSGNRLVGVVV